jgi:hypothetical protein
MCIYFLALKAEWRGVTVFLRTAKDCSSGRSRFVLLAEKVESCLCVRVCVSVIYSVGKLIFWVSHCNGYLSGSS